MEPVRDAVAVVGAGSLGCLVAAWLHEDGVATRLCLRHDVDAVVVEESGDARTVPVPTSTSPDQVAPVDVVLLTVKAQDTTSTAPWLDALVDEQTVVVPVQNGVDHRDRLRGIVEDRQVLPALAWISAERTEPGHVRHQAGRRIAVPAGEVADRVTSVLVPGPGLGRLRVEPHPDFVTAAWRKLLGNVVGNPVTTLTLGRTRIFEDPSVAALARDLLDEALLVGRAEGADLGPDDADAVLRMFAGLPPDNGSSMLTDRLAHRPLEHEHLTGALVAAADRHGLDVPRHRTVLALLRGLDATLRRDRDRDGQQHGQQHGTPG